MDILLERAVIQTAPAIFMLKHKLPSLGENNKIRVARNSHSISGHAEVAAIENRRLLRDSVLTPIDILTHCQQGKQKTP